MSWPRRPPNAPQPHGGVTWVTALVLLLLAGGAYLALMWGPVYVLQYEVKQVARDYANQAVKNPDDAQLVADMLHKLRVLDETLEYDEYGKAQKVPTVQVDPTQVVWQRDTSSQPPMLQVSFQYTRSVRYPFLDRWTTKTLFVEFENDLTRPDWGPAR